MYKSNIVYTTFHTPPHSIHASAWSFLTSSTPLRKGITLFYNIFQQKQTFVKSPSHIQWETDLQQSFTPMQWYEACKTTQKASSCSTLWELLVKITLQWYYTPATLSRFNPQLSDSCWRHCGTRGDLIHVLWSCPKLLLYWRKVFHIISDIAQQQVLRNPALARLSIARDRPISSHLATHNCSLTSSSEINHYQKMEK